ncbi:MAG: PilN domain-containing protein [Candidatus Eisenbacteria bacterium]|nr:PilN domain-containing protein [Candidatus Eisenbacteria bacterium]
MYDVNFIRQRIVPESRKKAILGIMSVSALALVLTLACLGTATLSDLKVSQVYASQEKVALDAVGDGCQGAPTRGELESIIAKTEPTVREIGKLAERRTRMAPVLERVALAIPDGVWLTRISLADPRSTDEEQRSRGKPRCYKGLIIEGVALAGRGPEGDMAVSAFVDSLKHDEEMSSHIKGVEFVGTGLQQVGGTSVVGFEVTCPF